MSSKHSSHQTRFSWGASTFDEICILCGATDQVPGSWGDLAFPCPGGQSSNASDEEKEVKELINKAVEGVFKDED